MDLREVLSALEGLPADERAAICADAMESTKDMPWVPNPGPQSDAYFTQADETFFGGQAGGGKTDLAIGLALTAHKRTLLLRRINKDAVKLVPRMQEIIGHRVGYNGQNQSWRLPDRQVDIAGCEAEDDKQRFKGDPHDLIDFEEICDFLESQYRFIIGWNRSADPKQRCRVLCTGNPPTDAEGLWVVLYWGAWLDPTHPHPAKPGELRWYTTIAGRDTEVDGPGPHILEGEPEPVVARSRTFIPSTLADNPDLAATNYGSVLASMPEELRRAYRDGRFDAALADKPFQCIPTGWILAAQARWKPDGYKGSAMTAISLDPAGGGRDSAEIAPRYGGWYAPLISAQGEETADGSATAATVVQHRKDACPVVVDVGGGYAGGVIVRFKDNEIPYASFNGASTSTAKTKDGKLSFVNKRAEAWWKFREELDPDQEGGSAIALPPDAELRADLAAPTFTVKRGGILLEDKQSIRVRIGRSPGKGDAVVMALSEGDKAAQRAIRNRTGANRPQVIMAKRTR